MYENKKVLNKLTKIKEPRKKEWRITDVAFFGSIFLMLLSVLVFVVIQADPPEHLTFIWLGFMGIIVLPKMFLPNTKFVRWLEKPRW